jgi:hypothetical protein
MLVMRILIQPRNGDSIEKVVNNAIKILQDGHIASSKGGDDRPAVLIEADDLTLVLETLERARLRVLVA